MIRRIARCLFGASLIVALAIGPSHAANLVTLYSFCARTNCSDGATPGAGLIADANGNLFGTTVFGGANGQGTVFEITKTASGYATTPTILYSFCAQTQCTDGRNPFAGLIVDANGDLFGTTLAGGANGAGTVFEITKTASGYATTPTILYSFCAQTNSSGICTDGANPFAGLIADANGDLFGTTNGGGANGAGTVFELGKSATGYASTPIVLYSFCAQINSSGICTDGGLPTAGLILDAAGNLFGTTEGGGANGEGGTVFEIANATSGHASTAIILYSFCAQTNSSGICTDGNQPHAGLIADANGDLFGTTELGGANGGGTVFEIAKTASGYATTPTILYSFCAQTNSSGICTDGNAPVAGLVADANGDLFGTTVFGGPNATGGGSAPGGTVFEIAKTPSGYATTPTILYSFCAQTNCTDGANPFAGLIADPHGDLFGTSEVGGAHGWGTVFEVTFFAGTPGRANCIGKSVSALTQQNGGLANAAAAFGYSGVLALQNAIASHCAE